MPPKKNRLPNQDFAKIFKKGNRIHNNYFVMLSSRNTKVKTPQIGVIASLKVGKAVKRNAAKRKVREILRQELSKIDPNSQIIIICKPTITSLPHQRLREQLLAALKKANLHRNNV
jgi:ribonuclease P protein component